MTGDQLRLDGRTALITGATRGIGRAIAEAFAGAGAAICVVARKADEVAETVAALRRSGAPAVGHVGSVGDPTVVEDSVARAVEAFGGVDILVNNAATNPAFGVLAECDPDRVRATWQINQEAPFRYVQTVWKATMAERGGVVLNIVSVGGFQPEPMIGAYNTSKAALIHMTRQWALEMAPAVRVNALAPGLVRTSFSRALIDAHETAATARHPLGRLGTPDDVAAGALYLCSDAASWVTGQVLVVDGGASLAGSTVT